MESSTNLDQTVPPVAWTYGLLGLIPFAGGAAAALIFEGATRVSAQFGLLIYGGLILSFLGGGRWGLEIGRGVLRTGLITGAMAGAVVSALLIAATGVALSWRLLGLALAHLGQWAWDVRSSQTPPWYPKLRHALTAGAVISLLTGSAASLHV